jgi:hypothetical protein
MVSEAPVGKLWSLSYYIRQELVPNTDHSFTGVGLAYLTDGRRTHWVASPLEPCIMAARSDGHWSHHYLLRYLLLFQKKRCRDPTQAYSSR